MNAGRAESGNKHARPARRFAKALYDLATEQGCLDEVLFDMASIARALGGSRESVPFLLAICRALPSLDERARGVVKVVLTTAFPMEGDDISAISGMIRERLPSPAEISVAVDPDLIGGFSYRVGDVVYDYSIKGALSELKRVLVGG